MEFSKSELREKYKEKRLALSDEKAKEYSQKIFDNLLNHFNFEEGENVMIFLPIRKLKEIDTQPIINYFWKIGINIYLPKVAEMGMFPLAYTSSTLLETNQWGIQEPVGSLFSEIKFDKIILPLLYADTFGNRIGYGKGFYDQFLAGLHNQPLRIGINYFNPKEKITDVEKTDIPLDYLVTSDSFFDFTTLSKSIK